MNNLKVWREFNIKFQFAIKYAGKDEYYNNFRSYNYIKYTIIYFIYFIRFSYYSVQLFFSAVSHCQSNRLSRLYCFVVPLFCQMACLFVISRLPKCSITDCHFHYELFIFIVCASLQQNCVYPFNISGSSARTNGREILQT